MVAVGRAYVDVLRAGEAGYASVFCAVFVGAAVGSYFGLRWLKELSRARFFGLSIILAGLTLAGIALIHNLVIVVVLTFVAGVFAGIAWIIGFTMVEGGGRGPADRSTSSTPSPGSCSSAWSRWPPWWAGSSATTS